MELINGKHNKLGKKRDNPSVMERDTMYIEKI